MVDLGLIDAPLYSPRPGDIGITQISGVGGKAIRAAQWLAGCGYADYEHAFMVTDWPDPATCMIVEAMPGGARHIENPHDPSRTLWLPCPDYARGKVSLSARMCAQQKIKYSEADYLAQAAHRFHIPLPYLKTYIESSGHMICSQLVDWCALQGGWHLFDDGRWPGYVKPCDLVALYRKEQHEAWKADFTDRLRNGEV